MLSVHNFKQFHAKNFEIIIFIVLVAIFISFVGFGSFAVVNCKDL